MAPSFMAKFSAAIIAIGSVFVLFLAPCAHSAEADVATFYEGKQIRLLIGYPPGGGYDAYGRLLSRYLGSQFPGNPKVIPGNMPGAGSIVLANYLFNRAPKDGSVIGIIAGDAALNPLFRHPEAHYDSLKLSWIGSMSEETSTCFAWHTAPIRTIEDAFRREFVIGTASSTGTTFSYPTSSNFLLGTKFKIIPGYEGTNRAMLAVERGEIEGMCGTAWNSIKSSHPSWLENKLIRIILQEATHRHPDLPDVPTVMDIATTEHQKQVLEMIYGWQIMGRPVVAPPDIPPERLAALRRAFDATMSSPTLLADAEKIRLDIGPIRGEEVDAFLARVYHTPATIISEAATALGRRK